MANIDSHVASVLDASGSDDEDALIASLEDSPALDAFREQRIQQLHSEFTRAKAQKSQGFASYTEIKEEKALMDLTTEVKYAVVHFAKDDFARCRTMDVHLEVRKVYCVKGNSVANRSQSLAKKHFDTRFLKMNVENAPFLVTKLKIQVLPCVLAFVNGLSVDRIVGFEGLGYTQDTFTTKDLEARLLSSGVVQRAKATMDAGIGSLGGRGAEGKDASDDEDGWD
jgi:thiol-disulfide isomerase/thioredoxin